MPNIRNTAIQGAGWTASDGPSNAQDNHHHRRGVSRYPEQAGLSERLQAAPNSDPIPEFRIRNVGVAGSNPVTPTKIKDLRAFRSISGVSSAVPARGEVATDRNQQIASRPDSTSDHYPALAIWLTLARAPTFAAAFLSRGIDIRRDYPPLEDWVHISIGLPQENTLPLDALCGIREARLTRASTRNNAATQVSIPVGEGSTADGVSEFADVLLPGIEAIQALTAVRIPGASRFVQCRRE
jgi:hypothetical protein